jgi:hypothetical protein
MSKIHTNISIQRVQYLSNNGNARVPDEGRQISGDCGHDDGEEVK